MLEPIDVAGLPLLSGGDRAPDPIALAFWGEAGLPFIGCTEPPLIGVMVAELLGAPMPASDMPLLLPLLPRGMKVLLEPVEPGV